MLEKRNFKVIAQFRDSRRKEKTPETDRSLARLSSQTVTSFVA